MSTTDNITLWIIIERYTGPLADGDDFYIWPTAYYKREDAIAQIMKEHLDAELQLENRSSTILKSNKEELMISVAKVTVY